MAELTEERREQLRAAGRKGAKAVAERGTLKNGWTKRSELRDVEAIRRRVDVGRILGRLERIGEGKEDASPSQIAALKILADKTIPSLSAVENTQIDPSAALGESDIREQLRSLLAAHPDVVAELLGEQARKAREGDKAASTPSESVQKVA